MFDKLVTSLAVHACSYRFGVPDDCATSIVLICDIRWYTALEPVVNRLIPADLFPTQVQTIPVQSLSVLPG